MFLCQDLSVPTPEDKQTVVSQQDRCLVYYRDGTET